MHEALSSIPDTARKKERKEERKKTEKITNFCVHLFTYAYIVWVISPPCPQPTFFPLIPLGF
jgi:hypothetical protein